MIIDKSASCAACLRRYGRRCRVHMSDGTEFDTHAIIQQIWRRLKSKFEPVSTLPGGAYTDYYLYYGPADFDITAMTRDDIFESDGIRFYFVRSERVIVGNVVQYYAGVLRRVYEEDESIYE